MRIAQLEPFGLSTLAGGILYSMSVFMINAHDYKFHFIVLTIIIFIALFTIATYKYLKYKFTCEKMDEIIDMMSIKKN